MGTTLYLILSYLLYLKSKKTKQYSVLTLQKTKSDQKYIGPKSYKLE